MNGLNVLFNRHAGFVVSLSRTVICYTVEKPGLGVSTSLLSWLCSFTVNPFHKGVIPEIASPTTRVRNDRKLGGGDHVTDIG